MLLLALDTKSLDAVRLKVVDTSHQSTYVFTAPSVGIFVLVPVILVKNVLPESFIPPDASSITKLLSDVVVCNGFNAP
jgi:hypothetical protein